MICAKSPGRELRTPVREVKNTKYYNKDIHRTAFVLPEFTKVLLEQGKDIRPKFGRAAKAVEAEAAGRRKKKVLLLGSGFVARPCAEYVVRNPENELTIGGSLFRSRLLLY
jgi:spermidine synthase